LSTTASGARSTVWFVALSLGISWAIGFYWIRHPQHGWLSQYMMATPGVVGCACAFVFHREPPRAAGFAFTGWLPWLVAAIYPLILVAAALGLTYAVAPQLIVYQPEKISGAVAPLALTLGRTVAVWLAVALFYRFFRDKLGRVGGALTGVAAWTMVVLLYPGRRLAPPGAVGEELGWRGFLVRRWMHRPVVALLIGVPIWSAFHLPVIFAETQRGHVTQNLTFLGAIAAAAPVFAAFYRWSRSVWPCAVAHMAWNLWNPLILGDVYGGQSGLFGGAVWFFNGEGVCKLILNGAVSLYLVRRALHSSRGPRPQPARQE
jgi:membrane protease YdiL (CAAX protease family)